MILELGKAHYDCPSRSTCRVCGKRHYSLLHRSRPSAQTTNESTTTESINAQASSSTNAHTAPSSNTTRGEAKVVLGICQVTIESRGRRQKARALLDSGSHMSFLTNRLAQSLKVKRIHEPTQLTGISKTEIPACPYKVELFLLPDGHDSIPMTAVIISKITGDLPGYLPFLQDLTLADPNFDKPERGSIYFLVPMYSINSCYLGEDLLQMAHYTLGKLCLAGQSEESIFPNHLPWNHFFVFIPEQPIPTPTTC